MDTNGSRKQCLLVVPAGKYVCLALGRELDLSQVRKGTTLRLPTVPNGEVVEFQVEWIDEHDRRHRERNPVIVWLQPPSRFNLERLPRPPREDGWHLSTRGLLPCHDPLW